MYHSLQIKTFPGRGSGSLTFDTYKDFFLVPTSVPVINPPTVKAKTIEVPGANGAIDLTESLTPFPVYGDRTGSIEFAVLNNRREWYNLYKTIHGVKNQHALDGERAWSLLYSDITNKLHGRKCQIILEDDPEWYYEGRIAVNSWKSSNNGGWPTITLDYTLYPYKFSISSSTDGASGTGSDRWKWDPFSFIDGIILNNESGDSSVPSGYTSADGVWKNIVVNSSSYASYGMILNNRTVMDRTLTGWMPVSPTITIAANSTNMGIKITNPELGYVYEKEFDSATVNKTYADPECILYDYLGNGYTLQLKGQGTITISFRKGSL